MLQSRRIPGQKNANRKKIDLTVYRPDYRKYLSPGILCIPYKWFAPQTPPQKNQKNPEKKNPSTGHPMARTLVEFKEKFQISFFHDMQIMSEPLCSDPCTRLKIQIPMHSISWGCPKIVCHSDPSSLLINTFDIHLEPGCKSHGQIIHYHTAKNVQKQATVLLYFKMSSYKLTRKVFPILWSVFPLPREWT